VTTDGRRIRVDARAADGARERKFWVDNLAGDAGDTDALEHEIASAVDAALGTAKRTPN
jgi:hypothetical protein